MELLPRSSSGGEGAFLAAGCAAHFSVLLLLCLCYQWSWLQANKKAHLKVWKTQHRSVQITLSSPGKSSLNKINTMRQTVERSHGKFNRANLLTETGWWHLQQNSLKRESEAGPGLGQPVVTSHNAAVMAQIWVCSTDEINQPLSRVRNSHRATGTRHKPRAASQKSLPCAKQPQLSLGGPSLAVGSQHIPSRCGPRCTSEVLVPPSRAAHIHHTHLSQSVAEE